MVLEEYRTSYLSGPVLKSDGSSQCRISCASMVWICDRLTGGLGFTVEKEQIFSDTEAHVCSVFFTLDINYSVTMPL